ncbi:DsbA family protein [Tabrizicola sp. SY72]|uniref:DsbA family protein n=1 Tax=Tabrizicola sp. SY72 TaxID=2741673 RepID=UPI0015719314|nr:DsbA family protein [Tabrizicola sp. SY72]NTT84622.1 DsbA family protein [Tabrizicola sp. SY72]
MNFKPGLTALALTAGLGLFAALAPLPVAAQETAPATAAVDAIQDFSIGVPDAKVQIIEYASFTCPHCARFHEEVFGKLKADYIDTGKVRFTYREVYFDRYGLWAAMMARCGGEMRYFGITDILFSTQGEWAASDDPAAVVANLKKIGRTAGMDDAALDACMKDGATAEALVAHFEKNFTADGVEGTPTFFINGVKHSNMGYDDLKALIEAELAK